MREGLVGGAGAVYMWTIGIGAAALLLAMAGRSLAERLGLWWHRRTDPDGAAARRDEFVRRLVERHRLGRAVASRPPDVWYESPRRIAARLSRQGSAGA